MADRVFIGVLKPTGTMQEGLAIIAGKQEYETRFGQQVDMRVNEASQFDISFGVELATRDHFLGYMREKFPDYEFQISIDPQDRVEFKYEIAGVLGTW